METEETKANVSTKSVDPLEKSCEDEDDSINPSQELISKLGIQWVSIRTVSSHNNK